MIVVLRVSLCFRSLNPIIICHRQVWGLDVHQLLYSFPGEHSKSTFFKNVGSSSGVTQVSVGPDHQLFSCGGDGSMKFRQLPEKDFGVRQWPS